MAIDSTTLEEDQNSDSVPRRSKKPDPSGTKDVEPDSGDPKTTTTLFVSNLAESVDSAKLLECASSIGPVRDAFVVSDPAKSKSRGFGYVRFVLREDAETALKDGLGTFEGQPKVPLVTWAKPKLKPEERDQKRLRLTEPPARNRNRLVQDESDERLGEPELKKKRNNPLAQIKKDPFANRIVVLQGLPIPPTNEGNDASQTETNGEEENQGDSEVDLPQRTGTSSFIPTKSITSKALYKKAKKFGKLESVEFPVPSPPGASSTSAHLTFADPTSAAIAQTKLHGHIFKANFLTTALKSRLDAITRLGHAFGGRLIIRNLQFDISEQDLRYLFAPFGPIHSIDIPLTTPEGTSKPRGRGFAFVWMLSEADAAKAIEGLNGRKVYTGICLEAIQQETGAEKKSAKRKRQKASDSEERGRVMAVDWVLSKQKYEEAEAAEDQTMTARDPESVQSDHESSTGTGSSEDDDDDQESNESETDSLEGSEADTLSDDNHESQQLERKSIAKETEGTTLFVRNLSFEATEQELHALFRPFGPLRYARIVMDPKLGRSRGTGFVCLWNKDDAQNILDLAKKLESQGFGQGPPAANGQPSLLQPDPSSSLAARLSLHGRVLGISEAVSREQAEKLRIDRDKSGAGKDKRHLYLMREGVIFPNSNEARNLHPADLAARQQSFDQRKALLRSNLSLYISFTRLSIRQLPLYVSERCLKRLARYSLDQWRKEVKVGKRQELTEEELSRDVRLENKLASTKKKEIKSKVKQVKILRTTEKTDGLSGLGKSKGYGFLEMNTHADSLRVLRWANANPVVDNLLKEWTCEEIERSIQQRDNQATAESKRSNDKQQKPKDQKTDDKRIDKLKVKLAELRSELDKSKKRQKAAPSISNSKNEGDISSIKSHRMLIIEFAIENAQTVKKRLERKPKLREKDGAKVGNSPEKENQRVDKANQPDRRDSKKSTDKTKPDKRHREKKSKSSSSVAKDVNLVKNHDSSRETQSKLARIIGQKRKARKLKNKH